MRGTILAGVALAALAGGVASAAPLQSSRLEALRQTASVPGATAEFWAGVRRSGAPLVEPQSDGGTLVTFLWRGETQREVELSWPVWTADRRENHLARLPGTDVWFKTVRLPAGTRLSYQLAADPKRGAPGDRAAYRAGLLAALKPDPLNIRRWEKSSVVELPGAPAQPWVSPRLGVAQGAVTTATFESAQLGNRRDITIYRPAGVKPDVRTPLLIVFDADRYTSSIPTPTILDNLIAARAIPPVTAVFVANPTRESRGQELACNPRFADMLADELVPWIAARAAVGDTPGERILAGSSFGGLISACAALRRPETFGVVLSQSGSFWWEPEGATKPVSGLGWVAREVEASDRKPVRFYLDAGLLNFRSRATISWSPTARVRPWRARGSPCATSGSSKPASGARARSGSRLASATSAR